MSVRLMIARIAILALLLNMVLTLVAHAALVAHAELPQPPSATDEPVHSVPLLLPSHRLIVELSSPPLAAAYLNNVSAAAVNGKLDVHTTAAQQYVSQLQAEQAAFASSMRSVLSDASVATYMNEMGISEQATYQVVFNGLAVDPGSTPRHEARQRLMALPGVRNVYLDRPYTTQLYSSTELVNAPALWDDTTIGGRTQAGAGVKIASIDGGVHHLAPMMDGAGYSYPPGYGPRGLGLTANNNGKIIVSRTYFRPWDPPSPGDENAWPGVSGTSHGVHTASIAAGNIVTATYLGLDLGPISGIAPKAYVMSYRVFYASLNNLGVFYSAEGIAAIEDMVKDGADVVNNSWGGGPSSSGGTFDPLDQALINATEAGVFVAIANGNAGPSLGTADHPSSAYMNVVASTTTGKLSAGHVGVPDESKLQNTPDLIADFSSRGPGVGNTLKPDIAAPGVNVLAQGFTPGATGEARHLGYGEVSGTSMAAPHVAGAAALLRQAHPDWPTAWIKSALMSTSKYTNIYLADGVSPAQPLDMGAGRMDLSRVLEPGLILDPPSLSFGTVYSGAQKIISVTVTSVASTTETYNLSTLYTGDGFTLTKRLDGFSVTPPLVSLNPGDSTTIQVTFDSKAVAGAIGDKQGYIIMDGANHQAHMPAWARVVPAAPEKDVLLIDGDFSTLGTSYGYSHDDYRWYYTDALDQLGYSYHVLDYEPDLLPDAATLAGYSVILYFSGDNDVTYAGLLSEEMDRLVEYLNSSGAVLVMGQSIARVLDTNQTNQNIPPFFYQAVLGANWIQESVTGGGAPYTYILPASEAPKVLQNVVLDLRSPLRYDASGVLLGDNVSPTTATMEAAGRFEMQYDSEQKRTTFQVSVIPTTAAPIIVNSVHLHQGAAGITGPVIRDLAASATITLPLLVTDSLTIAGVVTPSLPMTEVDQLLNGQFYIDVHTAANPTGEIRGQVEPVARDNQPSMDELDNRSHNIEDNPAADRLFPSTPIFYYPGISNIYSGTVGLAHRERLSLERPGITYPGRTIYTSFGLEGLSQEADVTDTNMTSLNRSELLGLLLGWLWSEPPTSVQIADTVAPSSGLLSFEGTTTYELPRASEAPDPQPVHYRWDFGDERLSRPSSSSSINHFFICADNNTYTVRVEVTDNYGNVALGSKIIDTTDTCADPSTVDHLYLPTISR